MKKIDAIDITAIYEGRMSKNTVNTYRHQFAYYMAYAKSYYRAFDPETVQAYQQYLIAETNASIRTIKTRISTIKSVARYLFEEGYISRLTYLLIRDVGVPTRGSLPHRSTKQYVTITPEKMREICNIPIPTLFNPVPVRDRALLLLLATTGIRASEARRIQTEDIVRVGDGYMLRNVKIRDDVTPRSVPISDEVYHAIQDWLHVRSTHGSYVFNQTRVYHNENILWNDNPMSSDAINIVIKEYSRMAGLENITAHDFRRFAGQQMAKQSVAASDKLLGYKSAYTTARLLTEQEDDIPMVQF